jgi:tetratricopeptide (TPR) repeat protein
LEKLSQFHDLNSERVLEIGNAYLGTGRFTKAERSYTIGAKMVGAQSNDTRFQEGLAKVKVAEGDVQSALAILGKPSLSEGVLGFINMRAVLSIKNGQVEDGIRFYQMALEGCRDDKIVRAKLYFNMGLAYSKLKNDESAVRSFERSLELGGTEFTRAKVPLEISMRAAARRLKNSGPDGKPAGTSDGAQTESFDSLDEIELDDL